MYCLAANFHSFLAVYCIWNKRKYNWSYDFLKCMRYLAGITMCNLINTQQFTALPQKFCLRLFTTKQIQSSSSFIELSNNVFGFNLGAKKHEIKIFELGPVTNNAGKIQSKGSTCLPFYGKRKKFTGSKNNNKNSIVLQQIFTAFQQCIAFGIKGNPTEVMIF